MKKLILLLFIGCSLLVKSQNIEYKITVDGIGDNREFFSGKALSQTILGSRGAFEIGVEKDGHGIHAGLSHFLEFGADIDALKPNLTLYYEYHDPQKDFLFGAFPRRGRINFPLAMLTDTLLYYRPNIEGLLGEVRWDWGKQNAFVDWVSRQTDVKRENFMAGLSGEIFHKNIFLQNYVLLFHDAGAKIDIPGDHIKDYFGYALQAGIRNNASSRWQGSLKAGILSSLFRERSVTNGFDQSISFFTEVSGRYKNYGVKSVLSAGGAHRFAYGDRFYQVKNYWRTDVIWYFINGERVKGRFNLSFHVLNWNDLDQQQQLSVIYVLGGS
ncbi:MAG: hypothetical protein J7L95_01960 [Prolixibacteraceae bacterium]|nr:hypothetical protein [Prolixibacteraceae bacterium]